MYLDSSSRPSDRCSISKRFRYAAAQARTIPSSSGPGTMRDGWPWTRRRSCGDDWIMRPLDGVTVVSLEHAIAAPFATRQLADLGARVIKIERPGVGDFARGYDARVRGLASHFVWTNRSKESLTLDVKHPDAAAVLERLVLEKADVVVQNLAPGAAARLGLGYEALAAKKASIIVCDISGYGADGPYRDKKAYDLLIPSAAGFVSVTG